MASSSDGKRTRSHGSHPKAEATNHRCPQFSNNSFQHPYYRSNFPKYSEHHDNLQKSKDDQNRHFRIGSQQPSDSPGQPVEARYGDGYQFPYESRCVGQPAIDGSYRLSFRSVHEDRNPMLWHYQRSNQRRDQLSYLAPPDLGHPEPLYSPSNRAVYQNRFHMVQSSSKSESPQSPIKDLLEIDIVCGRGAPTLFHEGNRKFRDLIQQYQSLYMFSKRPDKPRVAWKVLEIVSAYGGRFVRRVKGRQQNSSTTTKERGATKKSSIYTWEQLNERQAYEKICQSLREGAPELRRRMLGRTEVGREAQEQKSGVNSKRNEMIEDYRQARKLETLNKQKDVEEILDDKDDSAAAAGAIAI